jgi:hypothetical protein
LLPTGITKPNDAALLEPVFVTLAADPAGPFDVYATAIVAAAPLLPVGITNPNCAAFSFPLFVTLAALPGGPFDV